MKLIFGEDAAVAAWVSEQLSVTIVPPFTAIGWLDNDMPAGGAVFNDYIGSNVELTMYGKPSVTVCRTIARYIFNQLGCTRVTARTRRSNKPTRRLLGRHFVFEATLRRFYGDDDALVYRLLRDECKWLRP